MAGINDSEAFARANQYSGSGSWLDEANSHDAALPGGSNDPTFFDHAEAQSNNYFRHPGIANNDLRVADSAALSITGDLDLRWVGVADDWTPASIEDTITKWFSNEASYGLRIETDGKLKLAWAVSMSAESQTSSAATSFTDGTKQGIRVTFDVDNGSSGADAKFYTLNDPDDDPTNTANWTQLGTTQTFGSTTSIDDGTAALSIGGNNQGTSQMLNGSTHRALIYDGIDGTLVLDINAADEDGDTVTQAGTFVESSAQAATVTVRQTGTAEVTRMVDRPHWWYDTDDFHSIPDDSQLDFANGENQTIGLGLRSYNWDGATDSVLAKWSAASGGYKLTVVSGGDPTYTIDDNTNVPTDTKAEEADGAASTLTGVRNTGDDDIEMFVAGVGSGSATTDSTTSTLATGDAVRIGADIDGNYFQGEIWSYAIIRSALTDAEVGTGSGTLHDDLLNQTAAVDATTTPASLAAVIAMPAPTIAYGGDPAPASLATVIAIPAPTITTLVTVTPATIAITAAMPAPTITYGGDPAPATIANVIAIPTATTLSTNEITPVTVVNVIAMPAATPLSTNEITPSTVVNTVAMPTATPLSTNEITPSTIVNVIAMFTVFKVAQPTAQIVLLSNKRSRLNLVADASSQLSLLTDERTRFELSSG